MTIPSDFLLLQRAVQNLGRIASPRKTRAALVGELFTIGSTSAHTLCRRFGIDPDERIGRDPLELAGMVMCQHCEEICTDQDDWCPHCGMVASKEGPE